jgi:hypothetical protein
MIKGKLRRLTRSHAISSKVWKWATGFVGAIVCYHRGAPDSMAGVMQCIADLATLSDVRRSLHHLLSVRCEVC